MSQEPTISRASKGNGTEEAAPLRVLILEDRPEDCELMIYELRRSGFAVQWQRMQTEPEFRRANLDDFDAILADYFMPNFTASRALSILKESGRDVPFIVVTGSISEEVAVEMMKLGAADYLLKDRLTRLGPALRHAIEACEVRKRQRESEQALRESEERFRSSFDQAAVGMALSTREGRWLRVNQKFCDMLGYTQAELMTMSFRDVTPPEDATVDQTNLARLLAGEVATITREKRYIRKDKSLVWASLTMSLGRPMGSYPGHVIAIIEDISVRKKAEEDRNLLLIREQAARALAEKATLAKDRFLAMVSHELRTPLTPVMAAIDLLQGTDLPADSADLVHTIRQNVVIETRLIQDLLDLTRLGAGGLTLRSSELDLCDLLRHCSEAVKPEVEAKQIAFDLACEARPTRICADAMRIRQIMCNVLGNAVKFTPEGGSIAVRCFTPRPGFTTITVKDTGIGMDEQTIARLFKQPFEQADQSITRRFGGMGLGLYLTRVLVELHGGHITAESPGVGKGSLITIEFPTEPAMAVETAKAEPPGEALPPHAGPLRVLLVEDNDDAQRLLGRFIQSQGFSVIPASDARQAIAACGRERVDLIVSDLGLPDISGWDMLKQIRTMTNCRQTPAIAVSGFGSTADIEKSAKSGYADHLVKPIDLALLGRRLQELSPRRQ